MPNQSHPEHSAPLDGEIATVLARQPREDRPAIGDVSARRHRFEATLTAIAAALPMPSDVSSSTTSVVGDCGPDVEVRILTPRRARSGAAVLYFHGGGFIAGSAASFDPLLARYATGSGVGFVSVDYALAPGASWPTPLTQGIAAYQWVLEAAFTLGYQPHRIAVMGDSAGGGLAASTALLARDRGLRVPAAQLLVYPMLAAPGDHRADPPDGALTWTRADDETAWRVAHPDPRAELITYASPSRANSLERMPRAYVEVGQLDLYRQSATRYVERLTRAGVATEFRTWAGTPHAFDLIAPNAAVTRRAVEGRLSMLRSL